MSLGWLFLTSLGLALAACSHANKPAQNLQKSFQGQRAYDHVAAQVNLGERSPGSPGLPKVRQYIKAEIQKSGLTMQSDPFTANTPDGPIPMENIIAIKPGERDDIIIIASHYDTKYFKNFRFVGANDGGSSTGALLELVTIMAGESHPYTLWFVFFDGEEALRHWSASDSRYGSRHLVESLQEKGELSKIKAMLLLDMIGDAKLTIRKDMSSSFWLTRIFWEVSKKLHYESYFLDSYMGIEDDHTPFLQVGVPAVDIIDFEYDNSANRYWHTAADTLDKISAQSLQITGEVTHNAIFAIERELAGNL
jgi:Zn-dependent M28 family amino/carboxypeptidase